MKYLRFRLFCQRHHWNSYLYFLNIICISKELMKNMIHSFPPNYLHSFILEEVWLYNYSPVLCLTIIKTQASKGNLWHLLLSPIIVYKESSQFIEDWTQSLTFDVLVPLSFCFLTTDFIPPKEESSRRRTPHRNTTLSILTWFIAVVLNIRDMWTLRVRKCMKY